ncbi:DUF4214 domain-containing protein [Subtercola sp. RTI3]|uniref:DUF4214 domain-containing protein n=1 Tax=Subtercola sp. RTI3 TaxID=3048639 RepID=UPI002B227CE5|nr:DUF4214 domain-containing protein [Subtercola sp. RTI3]MEA9984918.1 DUF4214 domain-containing protein [Subtercola sp. RTI3]
MKVFAAAVAAVVIMSTVMAAGPSATAAGLSGSVETMGSSIVLGTAASTDALPTVPVVTPTERVTPPYARASAPASASMQGAHEEVAGTSSISGMVGFVNKGALAGIPVTLLSIDADGNGTPLQTVTSGPTGAFAFPRLAAGTFVVGFDDTAGSFYPSYQYYGGSQFTTYGTEITLADSQSFDASYQMQVTSGITGTATCTTCSTPPDPVNTMIVIRAYQASTDTYVFVDSGHPAPDGSYGFNSLYPGYGYSVFIYPNGTTPFAAYSYSPDFVLNAGETTPQNVISRLLVSPVAGIYSDVNENVNALYYDFLKRLPNASDVAFWGNQIQQGANPNIIATGFVQSDEYRYIRIDAAYRAILGREPEAAGRLNWLNGMKAGILTTDDIETSFYASAEYFNRQGGTNEKFMAAIYTTLLGRSGTSSDYSFWASAIQTHGRAWVINQFWITPETIQQRVSNMYQLYLGRVPDSSGLAAWVGVALQIGDSGLRAGLTGSDEYYIRSQYRFL